MVTELLKNFYRLSVPLPDNPLKSLNSYIFKSKDRNLLIDTGFNRDSCREAILMQLKELNADLDKTDIFLTHLHSDHSGLGVDLISPGRNIYMGETDARCLNRHVDDDYWVLMDDMFVKAGFPKEDIGRVASVNPAKVDMPTKHYDYTCVKDGDTMESVNIRFGSLKLRDIHPDICVSIWKMKRFSLPEIMCYLILHQIYHAGWGVTIRFD